ncbi:MAG: TonB-dependent receptor, partial [Saprospiraceae bacterium]|nr:TonB-dependent receptor [Saprospiraceae bacterium]
SAGVRNPTLTDQYLNLNVGRATLLGNLDGYKDLYTLDSFIDYLESSFSTPLSFVDLDPIKPERVKTIEAGYRTTLFEKIYLDANYYYNIYNDFIGFKLLVDAEIDDLTGFPTNVDVFRISSNSDNEVTTQGFSIGANYYFGQYYQFAGNYSWNKLNKVFEDDPIIPAFNTPEHKYNLGISGRNIPLNWGNFPAKKLGFNMNYKWVQGFLFEGSPQFTGFIEDYGLLDAQINFDFSKINTILKIGASNVLDNKVFQTYGGPRIGRLGYISLLYEFEKK